MGNRYLISSSPFKALAYSRYGSGPALMLIHGFPASGALWNEIVAPLSGKFTLLIPDLPGAGDSTLDGEDTSMEELAAIVPAILDHADFDVCVLAGHSMGGYIALAAATAFSDRIGGLSLIHSTALPDDAARLEKRSKAITLIRKGGRQEFIRSAVPAMFSEAFRDSRPDAVQQLTEAGLRLPAKSIIAFYKAMMARPGRPDLLRDAAFPVQWLLGRNDITIPWRSCLQQSILPRVSFVTLYSACGHVSMIEQPAALCESLFRFADYCTQRRGDAK